MTTPVAVVRRRLAIEPDVARALGHRTRPGRPRSALVLVGRVRPRIVELVEHVRVDAAGAPLAVVRLGRAVALDRHVVRVDLRADPVEQDPPLATDGFAAPTRRARSRAVTLLDERAAQLAADLRRRGRRLASDASRIASDRAISSRRRSPPSEQRREHRPPAVGIGRLTVHDRPRQDPLGGRRIGEQRRRARDRRVPPGSRRRRPPAHPARRPGTSRPLPDGDQHDLRERRQPVDGAVRVVDPADLVDGAVDRRAASSGRSSSPRAGDDLLEARRARRRSGR